VATWANAQKVEESVKSKCTFVMNVIDIYQPERVPTYTNGDFNTRLGIFGLVDDEDERDRI
jgi:hypothetical protein